MKIIKVPRLPIWESDCDGRVARAMVQSKRNTPFVILKTGDACGFALGRSPGYGSKALVPPSRLSTVALETRFTATVAGAAVVRMK